MKILAVYTIFCGIILLIHWSVVHIYASACVPHSIPGIIQSFLTSASPPCILLQMIQYKSIELYNSIWGSITVALFSVISVILSWFNSYVKTNS